MSQVYHIFKEDLVAYFRDFVVLESQQQETPTYLLVLLTFKMLRKLKAATFQQF